MHRFAVSCILTVCLALLASSIQARPDQAKETTLAAELKVLEPLVNREWIGEMLSPDGSRRLKTSRRFQVALDGTVVRFFSGTPEIGSSSEGYLYWDRQAKAVAVFVVSSRGVSQSGTVTAEGNVITLQGKISFPERAFDYRNTFEVRPDGTVVDRWFQNAFGPWRPGHVVELTATR